MKRLIILLGILIFAVFGLYVGSKIVTPISTPQSGSFSNSPLLDTIKKVTTQNGIKPEQIPAMDIPIKVPEGFKIYVYADVPNARSMALGDDGTVYVGNKTGNNVYALPDKNGDGVVDNVITVAGGLRQPNGIAIKDNVLYVVDNTKILKFENISNTLNSPVSKVIYDGFISDEFHQWKYAAFGPDKKLYIALGSPCNTCEPQDPYGTIVRMNDDGTGMEVVARGIRNSVGFDWKPDNSELWFTDNGRDNLGDDTPPDELNRVSLPNQDFGFPYCHGTDVSDPEFGKKKPCSAFAAPVTLLDPHAAALGMKFYRGSMFPAEYKNVIFVAQHGSWNRTNKIGYRVLALRPNGTSYSVTPFAEGWLRPDGAVLGRPVDILELKDGSLLISDDAANKIYRVIYSR